MAKILIVEDERDLADIVRRQIESDGHEANVAHDGLAALDSARNDPPDLVILDLMLPGMDGLTVCRRLRERSVVPVIMLTALSQEADRVLGLEVGADDYLTKPFSSRELLARVRAILRRVEMIRGQDPHEEPEQIAVDELIIDIAERRVTMSSREIELTVKEYDILVMLARRPGRTFSRTFLLERIWGDDYEGTDRTVDTHVVRLRRKLGAFGDRIATVWGVGYRLER